MLSQVKNGDECSGFRTEHRWRPRTGKRVDGTSEERKEEQHRNIKRSYQGKVIQVPAGT